MMKMKTKGFAMRERAYPPPPPPGTTRAYNSHLPIYDAHPPSDRSLWKSCDPFSDVLEIYMFTRFNMYLKPDARVSYYERVFETIPKDGKFTWTKGRVERGKVYGVKESDGYYHYELRYDQGPKDEAWMEEQDWEYIKDLARTGRLLELAPNADKEIAKDHKYREEIHRVLEAARASKSPKRAGSAKAPSSRLIDGGDHLFFGDSSKSAMSTDADIEKRLRELEIKVAQHDEMIDELVKAAQEVLSKLELSDRQMENLQNELRRAATPGQKKRWLKRVKALAEGVGKLGVIASTKCSVM